MHRIAIIAIISGWLSHAENRLRFVMPTDFQRRLYRSFLKSNAPQFDVGGWFKEKRRHFYERSVKLQFKTFLAKSDFSIIVLVEKAERSLFSNCLTCFIFEGFTKSHWGGRNFAQGSTFNCNKLGLIFFSLSRAS